MKKQTFKSTVDRKKVLVVRALFLTAGAIILLGLSLCIYSMINHIEYAVLNSQIPGVVFGLVVTFLGVRYFLSVRKLKVEVYKPSSRFSWSNFKKQ